MEIHLRDSNGGSVGTVDVDELPAADSVIVADGRYYVRNQRNENQWREVVPVKVKGVEHIEPPKVEGSLPAVSAPKKEDDADK